MRGFDGSMETSIVEFPHDLVVMGTPPLGFAGSRTSETFMTGDAITPYMPGLSDIRETTVTFVAEAGGVCTGRFSVICGWYDSSWWNEAIKAKDGYPLITFFDVEYKMSNNQTLWHVNFNGPVNSFMIGLMVRGDGNT